MQIDFRIVTNHWGWKPKGIWNWLRIGWAWPIQIWGIEHGITSVRAYALLRHYQGEKDVKIPPQQGHQIFRRRVKIGPFCFAAGMYQK